MNKKTKKIILLISTILILLITIGYIYAISKGIIKLESIDNSTQISSDTQVGILMICAFVNILSIEYICKDFIIHKKKIIILNIIQLLLGSLFNIISAIINIVLVASKTSDVEQEIKEKEPLPELNDITKYKWYVYLIIFILLFTICYTPLTNLILIPDTKIVAIIMMIAMYMIQIAGLVIPMFNELKRDFIAFKNNLKLYLSNMLPRFGIISVLYLICSISVVAISGSLPNNQQALLSLPLYLTAFLAIVIGPLTEELMFRGFIKKFIKNDILFIIISSLVFGGLHVLSADSLQQLLFIIPYSVLGFAFSLNYVKTKNIVSNIFLHCAWNTMAVILVILTIL